MSMHEYLYCVFCGKNTLLNRIPLSSFERFNADWDLLQVRQASAGPGRGRKEKGVGGFKVVPELGMTVTEMLDSPEHRDYALGVKRRLLVIVKEYMRLGVISPDELKEIARA